MQSCSPRLTVQECLYTCYTPDLVLCSSNTANSVIRKGSLFKPYFIIVSTPECVELKDLFQRPNIDAIPWNIPSGSVLGHEGFAVVLSPWGLHCSYIVLPSFHYLIPACFMCCLIFLNLSFYMTTSFHMLVCTHTPVCLVILFGGRFGSGHAFVYKDMVPLLWVKCHLWFIKGLGHFSNLCLITCFISAPCQSRPMMLVVPILYLSSRCSDFVKGSDLFPCSCRARGKDLFRYYLQFSEKVGEEGKH